MTAGSSAPSRPTFRFALLAFVFALLATACSSTTTTTTSTADVADDAAETDTTTQDTSSGDDSGTDAAGAEPEPTAAPDPTAEPAADTESGSSDEPVDDSADEAPDADDPVQDAPDEEAPAEDDPDENEPATSSFASDDDFCRVARELDENDPFEDADIDPFSPEFFQAARDLYDGLLAIAPDEISDDVALVRDELLSINEKLAAVDYDFTNPAFAEVMESLDNGTLDAAAFRIEEYLENVCGIDTSAVEEIESDEIPALGLDEDALAGLSNIGPEEAALLLGQLNLDPEVQACLLEQLPELMGSEDPSILTQEICGSTLLDILSGLGG